MLIDDSYYNRREESLNEKYVPFNLIRKEWNFMKEEELKYLINIALNRKFGGMGRYYKSYSKRFKEIS